MSKEEELQELFDCVVAYENNTRDETARENLQSHKLWCLIHWPDETRETLKRAHRYFLNQKGFKVKEE